MGGAVGFGGIGALIGALAPPGAAFFAAVGAGLLGRELGMWIEVGLHRERAENSLLRERLKELEAAAGDTERLIELIDHRMDAKRKAEMEEATKAGAAEASDVVRTWWMTEGSPFSRYVLTAWDRAWQYVTRTPSKRFLERFDPLELVELRARFLEASERLEQLGQGADVESALRAWAEAYRDFVRAGTGLIELIKQPEWFMSIGPIVEAAREERDAVARRLRTALGGGSGADVIAELLESTDLLPSPFENETVVNRPPVEIPERRPLDYALHRIEPPIDRALRRIEYARSMT